MIWLTLYNINSKSLLPIVLTVILSLIAALIFGRIEFLAEKSSITYWVATAIFMLLGCTNSFLIGNWYERKEGRY